MKLHLHIATSTGSQDVSTLIALSLGDTDSRIKLGILLYGIILKYLLFFFLI